MPSGLYRFHKWECRSGNAVIEIVSVPKLVLPMLSLMFRVLDVTCIRFSMQTLASVLPVQIYTNVLLFVPGLILCYLCVCPAKAVYGKLETLKAHARCQANPPSTHFKQLEPNLVLPGLNVVLLVSNLVLPAPTLVLPLNLVLPPLNYIFVREKSPWPQPPKPGVQKTKKSCVIYSGQNISDN